MEKLIFSVGSYVDQSLFSLKNCTGQKVCVSPLGSPIILPGLTLGSALRGSSIRWELEDLICITAVFCLVLIPLNLKQD